MTHNGETTNYEALKQRVEQFNLSLLATTDTEVASLKFHLTPDAWEYDEMRQKQIIISPGVSAMNLKE